MLDQELRTEESCYQTRMKGVFRMKKKIIMLISITVCLCIGGVFVAHDVNANGYYHECYIPYNIKTGSWNTGIHISGDYFASETFFIRFGDGTGIYKEVYLDLADYPGGWTGTIEQLFDIPETLVLDKEDSTIMAPLDPIFSSPSVLIIYSEMGRFWVTQFIMNTVNGYGYQTFFSWQLSSWPHQDIILSDPLDMPYEAGDSSVKYSAAGID